MKFKFYPIRNESMKVIAKGFVISYTYRHDSLVVTVNENKQFSLIDLETLNNRNDLDEIPMGDIEGQTLNRAHYPELYSLFDGKISPVESVNPNFCSCNDQQAVSNQAYGETFIVCAKSKGGCGKEIGSKNVGVNIEGLYDK